MGPDAARTLLLIDDEPAQARLVAAIAARAGWRLVGAPDAAAALALLDRPEAHGVRAVLVDRWSPDMSGGEIVAELRARHPVLPILVLTAHSSVSLAVEAMRAGANDFLIKPIAADRLLAALDAATRNGAGTGGELRPMVEKIAHPLGFDEIVGSAPEFRSALAIAAKAARSRVPVLIDGEVGVGKQMVADAIHAASARAKRVLGIVSCGAIPNNLIESELFGHERGAFTGAFDRQLGRFVGADGGTLFLDEVDALSPEAQIKLLRVLQTGEVHRMGGRDPTHVDVRVIAATNRSLLDEVAAGRFREDLYYRLAIVHLTIPPLRKRSGDIPALVRHLLARIARQPGMRSLGITEGAMALLVGHPWPGNVRQLHNALFRAAVVCEGDALTIEDFPQVAHSRAGPAPSAAAAGGGVTLFEPNGHLRPLDAIEADVIRLAIGHYRGRMTEVARRLGIGRSTLYRKLGELGIDNAA
jgi:DNA-binding NtrC family response regulator